jgi:hypothetical protein
VGGREQRHSVIFSTELVENVFRLADACSRAGGDNG